MMTNSVEEDVESREKGVNDDEDDRLNTLMPIRGVQERRASLYGLVCGSFEIK
jgi:hypothetical protein